jgi:hypothetical protein
MRGYPIPPRLTVERAPDNRSGFVAVGSPPRPAPRGPSRAIPKTYIPEIRLAPTPPDAEVRPRRRFLKGR